jgi:hypothetical protein
MLLDEFYVRTTYQWRMYMLIPQQSGTAMSEIRGTLQEEAIWLLRTTRSAGLTSESITKNGICDIKSGC